jgi:DNA modification methylase
MSVQILIGDCRARLRELPDASVHCCVTSPPYYGLRAYGTNAQVWGGDPVCSHEWGDERKEWSDGRRAVHTLGKHASASVETLTANMRGAYCARCTAWRGELGSEPTPEHFIANLVAVFREVRRVLHPSGTLWCNLGDSYAVRGQNRSADFIERTGGNTGLNARNARTHEWTPIADGYKAKDLMLMPHRVALALQSDGWWLRSAIVWAKRAPMPESVTDRPTSAYEMVFLLSKRANYYYDAEAVREPLSSTPEEYLRAGKSVRENHAYGSVNGRPLGDKSFSEVPSGRNLRNFWLLSPESFDQAHFAVFPTEIPKRAILAGTSQRGVCPRCLAPWVRTTERGRVTAVGGAGKHDTAITRHEVRTSIAAYERLTTGWAPGCRCDAGEPIPATVLDCFGGSGTTGLVADRLGRDSILIELNPEYAAMARKRIESDAAFPGMAEVAVRDAEPLTLWGEETA